jgi:hypothetical protein
MIISSSLLKSARVNPSNQTFFYKRHIVFAFKIGCFAVNALFVANTQAQLQKLEYVGKQRLVGLTPGFKCKCTISKMSFVTKI